MSKEEALKAFEQMFSEIGACGASVIKAMIGSALTEKERTSDDKRRSNIHLEKYGISCTIFRTD